jgi:hypothetical protein
VAAGVLTFAELLERVGVDAAGPQRRRGRGAAALPPAAIIGWAADERLLRAAGATVTRVRRCCGLAGNFGMEKGHYEVSVAVAETHLLPAVRAHADAVVLADGMSCRVQLDDLADVPAMHLAELLALNCRDESPPPTPRDPAGPGGAPGGRRRRLGDEMSEPLLRVLPGCGAPARPRHPGQGGRLGTPEGQQPRWRRVELRYVDLKAGRHLQVTSYDDTQAHTANHAVGEAARDAVDELLDEPFGNWHVETTTQSHQVRVTKKLEAIAHTADRDTEVAIERDHDREKSRLLAEDDPVFVALGSRTPREDEAEPAREVPPGRGVPAPARLLDHRRDGKGHLRRPTAEDPLRIVDLGCGNAYLTFAAQRYLTEVRGCPCG